MLVGGQKRETSVNSYFILQGPDTFGASSLAAGTSDGLADRNIPHTAMVELVRIDVFFIYFGCMVLC